VGEGARGRVRGRGCAREAGERKYSWERAPEGGRGRGRVRGRGREGGCAGEGAQGEGKGKGGRKEGRGRGRVQGRGRERGCYASLSVVRLGLGKCGCNR
jgi:hypothetical protein